MYKTFISFVFLLFLCSCKTITINQQQLKTTKQQLLLGIIGTEKQFMFSDHYSNASLPEYKQQLKVNITQQQSNKASFKAYKEAFQYQSSNKKSSPQDSSSVIITVSIADIVNLLKELNSAYNKDVKDYLTLDNDATIITKLTMVLPEKQTQQLLQAEEVFLIQYGQKSYAMQLYSKGKTTTVVNFNEGVVFGYKAYSCCWQEDETYKLQIVDLVESNTSCPKRTYKSSKRAKKEINYFKL